MIAPPHLMADRSSGVAAGRWTNIVPGKVRDELMRCSQEGRGRLRRHIL